MVSSDCALVVFLLAHICSASAIPRVAASATICSERDCSASTEQIEETSLLQTRIVRGNAEQSTGTPKSSAKATNAQEDHCVPSSLDDSQDRIDNANARRNETLIEKYKKEGKILPSGFPILNVVHIPKCAGGSLIRASAPLGEYGFGWNNDALQQRPQQLLEATAHGCLVEQEPPTDLNQDFAEYMYGESDIFCAVREPYAKAISGACFMIQYNFLDVGVDDYLKAKLTEYESGNRHMETCFMIPQVDYLKGPFGCKRILDIEDLENDFNSLMQEYGMEELTLPGPEETHKCRVKCNETKNDLSAETIELIERIYAEDIKFWKEFKHNRSTGKAL